jgi:hypothetical protein
MKRTLCGFLILGGVIALCLIVWPRNTAECVLEDGSIITLSEVEVGRTNPYVHGTKLSKLLGNAVPAKGVSLGNFSLKRRSLVPAPYALPAPNAPKRELLTVQFHITPTPSSQADMIKPAFNRKFRLAITEGTNTFAYLSDFPGFTKHDDGLFAHVFATSYPRGAPLLTFRIQRRDTPTDRNWRDAATFVVKNPRVSTVKDWHPVESPRLTVGDRVLEVGELLVRNVPIHPTDMWDTTAELPIRFTRSGVVDNGWGILQGSIEDSIGNVDAVTGNRISTNGWIVHRMFRPLDPTKLWKFRVGCGEESQFTASNLFTVAVPFPLGALIHTNLGGFPCRIDFVNGRMLSMELTNEPPNVVMSLVRVEDGKGQNLDDRTGSWGQHMFWRRLELQRPTVVYVTVAIRPLHEVEFTLKPTWRPDTASKRGSK